MDEPKLIKKAKKGDDEAFKKLISHYQDQLYRTVYIYVRNRDDALDIIQETAYKAYVSLNQLKDPKYFKSWLIRISINNAYELLRVRKKVTRITDEFKNKYTEEINVTNKLERNIDLRDAVQKLDENYRIVIILFYYHDFSIQQIATYMGIPEGTVKTYLHRARKMLKEKMDGGVEAWINNGLRMK